MVINLPSAYNTEYSSVSLATMNLPRGILLYEPV